MSNEGVITDNPTPVAYYFKPATKKYIKEKYEYRGIQRRPVV